MNMNTPQKVGLLTCTALIGLVVIFHSPWDGYVFYEHLFNALSEHAVFFWFADVVHVYVSIVFLLVCLAIFFYLFRTPTDMAAHVEPEVQGDTGKENRGGSGTSL